MVPNIRIQTCNQQPIRRDGHFVLYWMIANRRLSWNFTLERALEWAAKLNKPLVILEALRCDYRWASDRLHHFILGGMADNAKQLDGMNVTYYPYIETETGAGKGLLAQLAKTACVLITDDFPAFFLPKMIAAAARQVTVRMEKVDSNGLLPMRAADQVFLRAYDFRRFLQKTLPDHLTQFPKPDPFAGRRLPRLEKLPREIAARWPKASPELLGGNPASFAHLPIDHGVQPAPACGGSYAAEKKMHRFIDAAVNVYADERNQPEKNGSSGLSPYLHFGHISAHQVFAEIMRKEGWNLSRLLPMANGSRNGWWGVSKSSEALLDQLITWRELGYNLCWQRHDYDHYESLPDWALKTLADHADDRREFVYTLEQFEQAETHDPLWNAAQRQLVTEGLIHNYLRMLWGKKILEWSRTPQEALAIMIELNNKYALDGRNPNSYSGIFWVLGRYDRAWGPERPIFGKVRYMSSENTARKFSVKNYIARWSNRQKDNEDFSHESH